MTEAMVCWKCGAALEDVQRPFPRLAECRACGAELHVCHLCVFYDPRVAGACAEERAEDVGDKEHANFCDYFEPRPGAFLPQDEAAGQAARAELEALFGAGPGAGKAASAVPPTEADAAREALERLFGADDDAPE